MDSQSYNTVVSIESEVRNKTRTPENGSIPLFLSSPKQTLNAYNYNNIITRNSIFIHRNTANSVLPRESKTYKTT